MKEVSYSFVFNAKALEREIKRTKATGYRWASKKRQKKKNSKKYGLLWKIHQMNLKNAMQVCRDLQDMMKGRGE